jgi:cellulose biosynthesis protein BcsQ
VSENVLNAADLALVPVIPTTLSVRTLDQITEFLGELDRRPDLLAFFSMVDGRKRLHAEIIGRLRAERDDVAAAAVPALSAVEQMVVRRAPLPVFAPSNRATTSYEELWAEVRERVA